MCRVRKRYDVRRVYLINRDKIACLDTGMSFDPPTVFNYFFAFIVGAQSDVQSRKTPVEIPP